MYNIFRVLVCTVFFIFYVKRNNELYFRDGTRRIDFVLVYRLSLDSSHEARRLLFLNQLASRQIEIEVIFFVLILFLKRLKIATVLY